MAKNFYKEIVSSDWLGRNENSYTNQRQERRMGWTKQKGSDAFSSYLFPLTEKEQRNLDSSAKVVFIRSALRQIVDNITKGTGKKVKIFFDGKKNITNRKDIFVSIKPIEDKERTFLENLDIVIGHAVHETAHCMYTTDDIESSVRNRGDENAGIKKAITNILEDERIEMLIGENVAGYASYFQPMKDYNFKTVLEAFRKARDASQQQVQKDIVDLLNTITCLIRYPSSVEENLVNKFEPELRQVMGILHPYPKTSAQLIKAADAVFDVISKYIDDNMEDDGDGDGDSDSDQPQEGEGNYSGTKSKKSKQQQSQNDKQDKQDKQDKSNNKQKDNSNDKGDSNGNKPDDKENKEEQGSGDSKGDSDSGGGKNGSEKDKQDKKDKGSGSDDLEQNEDKKDKGGGGDGGKNKDSEQGDDDDSEKDKGDSSEDSDGVGDDDSEDGEDDEDGENEDSDDPENSDEDGDEENENDSDDSDGGNNSGQADDSGNGEQNDSTSDDGGKSGSSSGGGTDTGAKERSEILNELDNTLRETLGRSMEQKGDEKLKGDLAHAAGQANSDEDSLDDTNNQSIEFNTLSNLHNLSANSIFTVFHDNSKSSRPDNYNEAVEDISKYAPAMRTKIQMFNRSQAEVYKGLYEGEFDEDALVEAKIGVKNVYQQKAFLKNNGATVVLLLDESGSMGGDVPLLQRIAVLFERALLNVNNVDFYCYGHTTQSTVGGVWSLGSSGAATRINVYYEGRKKGISGCLGSISSYANNRDGHAILATINRVRRFTDKHLIMFMVSDGDPSAGVPSEYTPITYTKACALAAEKYHNTSIIHIASDTRVHSEKMFKNYIKFRDMGTLVRNIGGILTKVITKVQMPEITYE